MNTETRTTMKCASCEVPIPYDENGFLDRCARLTRGDFRFDDDGNYDPESENVKFERFVCEKCFMEDPDLCAFFNRIDCRVR